MPEQEPYSEATELFNQGFKYQGTSIAPYTGHYIEGINPDGSYSYVVRDYSGDLKAEEHFRKHADRLAELRAQHGEDNVVIGPVLITASIDENGKYDLLDCVGIYVREVDELLPA